MTGSESGWAITGRLGLYTGWWFTRRDAIRAHVHDKLIVPCPQFSTVQDAWKHCRKNGDRAVKVTVTIQNASMRVSE